TGLLGLAAVTITLATMWVGYKVLFDGKSLHDVRNVIIGAILIVGASGFGAYWAS
ncbi:TrbC/VirB2 family protein, partial [Klebsiella michiganensis]